MGNTKPKVLVVGANGYIGSHISKRLLEKGFDIRLTGIEAKPLVEGGEYFQVDFTDFDAIEPVVKGVDLIYFFAGKTGNSNEGFNHPDRFIVGNEVTLVNLLNVVKELEEKPRIVFPSTRLLYKGDEQNEITESSPLDPKSIYAINKLACENYLKVYKANFGIDYSIFRISLPYGSFVQQPRVSYGVMSFLINRAKGGEGLLVYGEGTQRGSLIHIDDLIELLILGGVSNLTLNETFNIGGPDSLMMGDVVKAIAGKFGVSVDSVDWPDISKNTDQGSLVFNSDRMLNLFDYTYKFNFKSWLNQNEL